MVNHQPAALDRVFAAVADPSRRALIERLAAAESLTVSELAKPLPISLPAVMKHLDVLAGAGLVARRKTGRSVGERRVVQIAWLRDVAALERKRKRHRLSLLLKTLLRR